MKHSETITNSFGQFHGTTSIGERGQVVIPKELRETMKLQKGKKFLVMEKAGAIVLLPTDLMEQVVNNISNQLKKIKK